MELLTFLRRLHGELLRHGSGCTFDKSNEVHRYKLSLYCSLIEFAHAICVLAEHDAKIAIRVTLRALLEAAVDLINLCKNDAYAMQILAADETQWRKLFSRAASGDNPFLSALSSSSGFGELQASTESVLSELKARSLPWSIAKRFEEAGMKKEYEAVYLLLSRDAHSNASALLDRHYEQAGEDFRIVCHRERPISEFAAALDAASGLLLSAAEAIHNEFNPAALPEIARLAEEFAVVRDRLPA